MNALLTTAFYKKIISSFVLLATATSFASLAHAQYRPADFGDAAEQLRARISLPQSLDEGKSTISIYCQADVSVSGMLTGIMCFESSDDPLEQHTTAALGELTFIPAEDKGAAVPVRMQFRVIYSVSGEQPAIVLLPNLGTLQSQHGYEYFAPQERLDHPSWFESYDGKGQAFFNKGRLTRVIASVEADGKVGSVSTLEARGSGKRDAVTIEKALKNSRFIPGLVNGNPHEMHYVAVVNYLN